MIPRRFPPPPCGRHYPVFPGSDALGRKRNPQRPRKALLRVRIRPGLPPQGGSTRPSPGSLDPGLQTKPSAGHGSGRTCFSRQPHGDRQNRGARDTLRRVPGRPGPKTGGPGHARPHSKPCGASYIYEPHTASSVLPLMKPAPHRTDRTGIRRLAGASGARVDEGKILPKLPPSKGKPLVRSI